MGEVEDRPSEKEKEGRRVGVGVGGREGKGEARLGSLISRRFGSTRRESEGRVVFLPENFTFSPSIHQEKQTNTIQT